MRDGLGRSRSGASVAVALLRKGVTFRWGTCAGRCDLLGSGSSDLALNGRRDDSLAARAARDGEVNARLVSLVDVVGIPPPLKDTCTCGSALAIELRDGDAELLVVCRDAGGIGCVDIPVLQDAANNGVGRSLDDRDIGSTLIRIVRELHSLAWSRKVLTV